MKSSRSPKIPSAKHSTLTSLTLLPTNSSAYHPTISHSHLHGLTFDSLNPSTIIRHSFIRHSTVESNIPITERESSNKEDSSSSSIASKNDSSTISQSHVTRCTISGSNVDCSSVRETTLSNAEYISGSQVRNSTLSGTGRISQCKIRNAQCLDTTGDNRITPNAVTNTTKTEMNKSDIRDSTVGPSPCTINRSKLCKVKVSQSAIIDASLNDCDIDGCRIVKGKFSGLWLRNGIWEGGELVGKVKEGEEVVLKARNFAEIEEMEKRREQERARKIEGGGEKGKGIGIGLEKGVEDPVSAAAIRGMQGDRLLLPRESSGSKCRLQDDNAYADPPQVQPPHFDSLLPEAATTTSTAHDAQHTQRQKVPPLASKKQPHISMKEDCPASPSTDGYSSAAESVLDPDEDAEITYEAIPDVGVLGIDDAKPPPYAP
ncbi:hypothetical protein AJ78_05427 [Emergomyces pasteurianus Ep9510]|uniref:Uncharacterized protein n=1 Tax=Emergomyces pasteurianus Ep9510 TaxID=1447872 RepID=A0A1J9QGB0_9EURO|nr:hypothetical protein AJ78_05427 [Emergomyces pasteurianus Ep9510]